MNKLKRSIFFLLLFSLAYFVACNNNSNNNNINSSSNIIYSYNYPNVIVPNQQFQIDLKIDYKNLGDHWDICLASFNSLAFNVTGSTCVNQNEATYSNDIADITLPYDGYIYLSNPSLLSNNYENVNILLCYRGNETLYLSGCLEKDKECQFAVQGNQFPIIISQAYTVYQNNEYILYLDFYYNQSSDSSLYYITDKDTIENCNLNNINYDTYKFDYDLKYQIGSSNIENYQGNGSINMQTYQGFLKVPINYNQNLPNVYMELNLNYYVIQEQNLGSITIQSNT